MKRKPDKNRELVCQLEDRVLGTPACDEHGRIRRSWVMRCWAVRGKDSKWRWQKTARNGRILNSSVEYFYHKANARRALLNELSLSRMHMVVAK
jgi:hypothetical protein